MSLGRLLIATRDHLRSELDLGDLECNVMPGPEPPPSCGQRFVSVYGSNWSAVSDDIQADLGVHESYDIVCAVTFRSSYVPFDKLGESLYTKRLVGIEDFCRKVMGKVHRNQTILQNVNSMIEDDHTSSSGGMLEQLRWVSTDPTPLPVTGTWFNSDEPSAAGLVMECRFNQATRFSSFYSDGVGNYT